MHILVFFQDLLSSRGKIPMDFHFLQGQSPAQHCVTHGSSGGVLELLSLLAGSPSCDGGYTDRVLLLSFLISFPGSLPKLYLPH